MVYYNEIDPYAAQWLRNLIAAGHIAKGVVDTRSIRDVRAEDLKPYVQCHFFAGIGIWSHALRLAGWPDDRPAWTGSCPCQPFSSAGRQGGFADERHLWPEFHRLIAECRPPVVFGEQVASKDGLGWLDAVHADLEASDYAFGATDMCAAGVGAPHIRQRLWWVADTREAGRQQLGAHYYRSAEVGVGPSPESGSHDAGRSTTVGLGHGHHQGLGRRRSGHPTEEGRIVAVRPVAEAGESCGLADVAGIGREVAIQHTGSIGSQAEKRETDVIGSGSASVRASSTNGHWRDADWLFCRDGKWRPVEPGTFPLARGVTSRVGRLRAYGNAIVPQVAQVFIEAYLDSAS